MTAGAQTRTVNRHASVWWIAACLFAGVFMLGSLAAPASYDAHPMSTKIVSSPVDGHSDCDQWHVGLAGHCHSTTACFAYAQATSTSDVFDVLGTKQPQPSSQNNLTSRSLQPNPRPPKHSIQA